MNNKGKDSAREERVKAILDGFLRSGLNSESGSQDEHIDIDVITAFVEGNLSEREEAPVNSHLIDCSFCRRKSAELVKLDLLFAEETEALAISEEPTKVSDVLSGILGKLFGETDNAVFAHQEEETEEKSEEGEESSGD